MDFIIILKDEISNFIVNFFDDCIIFDRSLSKGDYVGGPSKKRESCVCWLAAAAIYSTNNGVKKLSRTIC